MAVEKGPVDVAPPGPLAGLKVIDLTHVMAGPVCALSLADLGADVVKVEKVPGGEDARRDTEPYNINGVSVSFMMMNRNKRGIAIDLKHERGRAVLDRMLARADVLLENYRPGTMARLGLDFADVHARHPHIVYASITGFGRTGPYRDRAGFDLITQGMSGLISITGEGPGRPPVKMGAPVTDITAGILLALGVLAAVQARHRTGRGQLVDTSLLEAGIIHTYWHSAIQFATGCSPGPLGTGHPLGAPYQAFPTADGRITLGTASEANWLRFVEAIEAPELGRDPRFKNNGARMANLAALEATLEAIFRRRTTAEWLARLEAAGVPAGPILSIGAMHADPHVRARAMIAAVEHPEAGRVETIGPPVKFSETPAEVRRAAPLYGEHTREVLREYGFDDAEIDDLAAAGAVVLGRPDSGLDGGRESIRR
ncbi:MAG: CoA transferase [Alphaproteobacteria bacterium]